MHRNFLALSTTFVTTLIIAACSGGGGSGGGGSTSGKATGPLSVPNATCGGNSCISKSSSLVSPVALSSKDAVLEYAGEIYSNFTETIIPGLNGVLYKLEQVAAENDLKTCADIAAVGDAMGFVLGSGYTVDVSSDTLDTLKTIPSPMDDSGVEMSRKFVFSYNSTKFAEAQIYCNSTTQRTFYIRLMDTSANMYEFWSQVDGDKRTIFGAMDTGSQKYTLFFKTATGTAFELHTVGKNVSYSGHTANFAIAGGANLSTGIADIGFVNESKSSVVPTTEADVPKAADNDANWLGSAIRHCYSSISTATITTTAGTCNGLLNPAPTTIPVRQSATAWSLDGMDHAVSTTF